MLQHLARTCFTRKKRKAIDKKRRDGIIIDVESCGLKIQTKGVFIKRKVGSVGYICLLDVPYPIPQMPLDFSLFKKRWCAKPLCGLAKRREWMRRFGAPTFRENFCKL
jgi:hypothetical protein